MADEQAPFRIATQNYVPEVLNIKLQDLLVLYVNLCKASSNPAIGYQDNEKTFQETWALLRNREIALKQQELEALLWCCIHLDELPEGSQFWHPNEKSVSSFIQGMLHHKKLKFYFDKVYNFFRTRKPKQGVAPENIVKIGDDNV
jgi:hypothetical protein